MQSPSSVASRRSPAIDRVPGQAPVSPTPATPRLAISLLIIYVACVVYGSLYPWSGWRHGAHPLDLSFLFEPRPRYWTWADLIANLALYLPLGALTGMLMRRQRRWWLRLLLPTLAGCVLSLAMESLQTLLPSRVASNLDWWMNTVGSMAGALLVLAWPNDSRDPMRTLRPDAGVMLLLLAVWMLAQLVALRIPFETGTLVVPMFNWLRALARMPDTGPIATLAAQLDEWAGPWMAWLIEPSVYGEWIESAAVALSLLSIGLILFELLRSSPLRPLLVAATLACALLLHLAPLDWLPVHRQSHWWLSPASQGGIVTGVLLLVLLSSLRRHRRMWLLLPVLACAWIATNLLPPNAYRDGIPIALQRTDWTNLVALIRAVSRLWPLAAMIVVARQLRRWRAHHHL